MIFSQADFDLLRLIRWSRHILPATIDGLFSERDIQNLIALGLIKIHQRSGSFVLTAKGNHLLNETLSIAVPDTPPSYRPAEMLRRLRLSTLGGDGLPRAYPYLYHGAGGVVRQPFFVPHRGGPRPGA